MTCTCCARPPGTPPLHGRPDGGLQLAAVGLALPALGALRLQARHGALEPLRVPRRLGHSAAVLVLPAILVPSVRRQDGRVGDQRVVPEGEERGLLVGVAVAVAAARRAAVDVADLAAVALEDALPDGSFAHVGQKLLQWPGGRPVHVASVPHCLPFGVLAGVEDLQLRRPLCDGPLGVHERLVQLFRAVGVHVRNLQLRHPPLHAAGEQGAEAGDRLRAQHLLREVVQELLPLQGSHVLQPGLVILAVPRLDVLPAHPLALMPYAKVRTQRLGVLAIDAELLAGVQEALDDVVQHELLQGVVQPQGLGERGLRDRRNRPSGSHRIRLPHRHEERHDDGGVLRVRRGLPELLQALAVHLDLLRVHRFGPREHLGERRARRLEVHAEQAVQLLEVEPGVLLPVQPPHHLEGFECEECAQDARDVLQEAVLHQAPEGRDHVGDPVVAYEIGFLRVLVGLLQDWQQVVEAAQARLVVARDHAAQQPHVQLGLVRVQLLDEPPDPGHQRVLEGAGHLCQDPAHAYGAEVLQRAGRVPLNEALHLYVVEDRDRVLDLHAGSWRLQLRSHELHHGQICHGDKVPGQHPLHAVGHGVGEVRDRGHARHAYDVEEAQQVDGKEPFEDLEVIGHLAHLTDALNGVGLAVEGYRVRAGGDLAQFVQVGLHLQDLLPQRCVEVHARGHRAPRQGPGVLGGVHLAQVLGLLRLVQLPHLVVLRDALHHRGHRLQPALQRPAQEGRAVLQPAALQELRELLRRGERRLQVLEVPDDLGALLPGGVGVDHFEDPQLAQEEVEAVGQHECHRLLGHRRLLAELDWRPVEPRLRRQVRQPEGVPADPEVDLARRSGPGLRLEHRAQHLQDGALVAAGREHPRDAGRHLFRVRAALQVDQRGSCGGVQLQHRRQSPRVRLAVG
mmetsp:Transcript_8875/g.27527  ORF Transcript_8875/g.27527 Transcript_8875/m.27527 type:complete len:906 (-) Transcript_8875:449-3166(-)